MRKAIIVALVCLTFLVAFVGIPAPAAPRAAAAAGGSTASSGDVNGDGRINITDAIYLVRHLFQGGPAPVALAQTATTAPAWPPRPADIVNLAGISGDFEINLVYPIYQVPGDRVLVITDAVLAPAPQAPDGVVSLVEDRNGEVAYKLPDGVVKLGHFSTTLGLVFSPGSKVAVRASTFFHYTLVGYLASP